MDEFKIGENIRKLRLENKLTLEQVAKKTGFTKSYISMLETGKKIPPIASLSKISKALNSEIAAFFQQKRPEEHFTLVRKKERIVVARNENIYRYESIASTKKLKKMEPFIVTIPSHIKREEIFDHEGEEMDFLLKGKLKFIYGDKEYILQEGDCIYFDSSIPHRGEGIGKKGAKVLCVISSS
jgi:transcriptional regulator with XRE-family HTH domain